MEKQTKITPYIIIFCLCVLLSATTINNLDKSFYWDESVYAHLAQHPLVNHLYSEFETTFTRHPPLYIYSLYLISKIPIQNEISFRLFSIFLSMAGISLIFLMSLNSSNLKKAIIIPLLLIFNTLFQQYAQSATMYSMLFFFHALLFYGISKKKTVIEVIAITGGLYTHYFMFLTVSIICLFDFCFSKKKFQAINWKKYFIILLLYMPWLYHAIPGILFHKKKFSDNNPSNNFLNFINTFGVGGLFILLLWTSYTIKNKFKNITDSFDNTSHYLKNLFMFLIILYIIIITYASPFLRYLYFIYPFFLIAYFDFFFEDLSLSKSVINLSEKLFFKKPAVIFLRIISFICILLLLYIPNFKLFGVFPYKNSYHDSGDNIHIQEWSGLVNYMEKKPIAIENVRSYFYYYAKKYPQYSNAQYPWSNIGIFELKFNKKDNTAKIPINTIGIINIPENQWKIEILKNNGFKELKKLTYMTIMQKKD